MMPAAPCAPLAVIEVDLALHLRAGALDTPAELRLAHEALHRRRCRQFGEPELRRAGLLLRPRLHEPHLFSGRLAAEMMARRANANRSAASTLRSTRTLASRVRLQCFLPQRRRELGESDRRVVASTEPCPWSASLAARWLGRRLRPGTRRPHLHGRLDTGDVPQATTRDSGAKIVHVTESGVGEHDVVTDACAAGGVDLLETALPVRTEGELVRNARLATARAVLNPRPRQREVHRDAAAAPLRRDVRADAHLTVVDAPEHARVPALDTDGMSSSASASTPGSSLSALRANRLKSSSSLHSDVVTQPCDRCRVASTWSSRFTSRRAISVILLRSPSSRGPVK